MGHVIGQDAGVPPPLAPRTRLFALILKRLAAEPSSEQEMVALRERREALRTTAPGRAVFGRVPRGVETSQVRLPEGLRALVHRPMHASGPLPVVVNFHGGGWCLGTPEQSAWLASHVALRVGAIVVSPSYRLAPEHPYPAAADDAWTALEWLLGNPPTGADLSRLALMGDSAGGNLAAVTALKARDAGAPAVRAQVLVYPAVEMYDRYPSEDEFAQAPVLTSKGMRRFSRHYLGAGYGTDDWQASPLRAASHTGLPPTLIITAGHDPLRDHGERYAEKLRAAGVEVDVRDYGAAIHGFLSLPGVVPVAKEALADTVGFLRERL
jgi:acetyl esterase